LGTSFEMYQNLKRNCQRYLKIKKGFKAEKKKR